MRVLVIEDDPNLNRQLGSALDSAGYVVESALDGEQGHFLGETSDFDAVVLDLGLPGLNGIDVLRKWRAAGRSMPVLILTARDLWSDKVAGIDAGADDYLAKPFDMMELMARIEAQIRRAASATQAITSQQYAFGAMAVDFRKAEVRRDGVEIEFSAREFQLLKYFIEHRGATLSRDELLNEVWGYNAMPSTRTVDVHVAWLRQKIEPNPRHPQFVLTVHGLGYKFVG